MSPVDYEVAIIGGGPCGLLSGLLLARRGVRCAVFERRIEPLTHPRAMGISRRSAEIFQQLGLRDVLKSDDLPAPAYLLSIWADSLVGEEYGRVPRPEDDPSVVPYPAFHCPQNHTERVLLDALEAESEASIFFDHEITALAEGVDSVELSAHRGRHDQTFTLRSRYVIAADGAASAVRSWLGIEAVGPGDLGHFLNVSFRAAYGACLEGRRAVLTQILRRELFEIFVAIDGRDLWLMHHFLQPGEKPADYSSERLAGIVAFASGLPHVPVEVLGVSPWVMSPKIAASFRKGRVFLTGDAAARLSPAGGLGMNTGLQSAHNLAWKLAAVLRGAPDRLLDTYDAERRDHVMRTFEVSGAFGSEIGGILTAGFAGDFDRVRALVGASRRGGGSPGLDLGWTYASGAFVGTSPIPVANAIDAYTPTADPGRRAPHLWLERDGSRLSILSLFGAGFALLVPDNAAPWRAAIDITETFSGFDLDVFQIGGADGYQDSAGRFSSLYALEAGEAVLVRPDGVVGWRSNGAGPAALRQVIDSILAGG